MSARRYGPQDGQPLKMTDYHQSKDELAGLPVTVAEKIRSAVAAMSVPGVPRAITVSIGVAVMPDDAGESVSLLQHADRRLYAAKGGGGEG